MHIVLISEISLDGKMSMEKETTSRDLIKLLPLEFAKDIHKFRATNDAILVGANTIKLDNSNLTNRYFGTHQPIRIIISNKLQFSLKENIFIDNNRTIIVTSIKNKENVMAKKIKDMGKECLFVGEEKVDIKNLIQILEQEYNIKSMIIEGGGEINYQFLSQQLFDELILYLLPILIGGKENTTLVDGGSSKDYLNKYELKEYEIIDNCIKLHYIKE